MTVDELVALHNVCFPNTPTTHEETAALLDHPASILLTVENGFLIGYIVPPEAEVIHLGVHPDARRRGKARELMDALAAKAASIVLEVAQDNAAARAFYTDYGFSELGRRKGYYLRADGSKIDALTMQRALTRR